MSEPAQRLIESNGIRLNIAEQGEGPLEEIEIGGRHRCMLP